MKDKRSKFKVHRPTHCFLESFTNSLVASVCHVRGLKHSDGIGLWSDAIICDPPQQLETALRSVNFHSRLSSRSSFKLRL